MHPDLARGQIPGIGRPPGMPSSAARGARPTSSALATARVPARPPRRPARAAPRAGRSTFIETCATPPLSATADRANSRQALRSALADEGRDPPGVLHRRRRGSAARLNATSGGLAATSVAPAVGCIRGGPKSGRSAARGSAVAGHPLGQPGDPTAAQLRARRAEPARSPAELAVQEHRHRQLRADPVGDDERLGARRPARRGIQVDDRRHVQRADVRDADPAGSSRRRGSRRSRRSARRPRGPREHRVRERSGRPGEREHRAVVVGVASERPAARTPSSADRAGERPPDARRSSPRRGPRRRSERRAVSVQASPAATVRSPS